MGKAAEFKRIPEAVLQAAPVAETPDISAENPLQEPEWRDFPAERKEYPFDGLPAVLTRDMESEQIGVWLNTRRYDAKQMRWVEDGFWVAPNTRRRLYPLGVEPIAYRPM